MHRHISILGERYATDIQIWQKALTMIPQMQAAAIENRSFQKTIKGTEIVSECMSEFAGTTTQLQNDFKEYLINQGAAIKSIMASKKTCPLIAAVMTIETSVKGNTVEYIPKIKLYKIELNPGNSLWIDGCGDTGLRNINFNYSYTEHNLNFLFQHPDNKSKMDAFIYGIHQFNIEEGSNFFEGYYHS